MLSRTADNLYWVARYMERMENLARIIRVADRLSLMPVSPPGAGADSAGDEWQSAIIVSGTSEGFYAKYEEATPEAVISYIAFDPENPSSIRSCIERARHNGRAIRTALTTEMWDCLNTTWLELPRWDESHVRGSGLHRFLDWVKDRALLFFGGTQATMLRRDSYYFAQLGTFIERGDNTARILDVKYHILLPEHAPVGSAVDYYQWSSILRAVSGFRSYYVLHKDGIKPWRVAEFLTIEEQMPRSLVNCMSRITENLNLLGDQYGQRHECHRTAGRLQSRLRFSRVEDIFRQGLHEFLTEYIDQNRQLGEEISKTYLS